MDSTQNNANVSPSRKDRRAKKLANRLRVFRNAVFGTGLALILCVASMYIVGFLTPWGTKYRLILAETVITTRHWYLAHLITTAAEYQQMADQLNQKVQQTNPSIVQISTTPTTDHPVIETQEISGPGYNGYVMLVHDPKLVRLVKARVHNKMGEYITDMAKRTGAVAGTNASGFEDPNGEGWGGEPVGLEMIDGQAVHQPYGDTSWTTVGFTKSGVMVMGNYDYAQLKKMGVRDAMQFHPELVVNGKPMITHGDGGWGYGPRTAVGQAKDGTVIFVVINGRFHGGSGMGASQRQVMDIMIQYGAVNACAMDGGSSSVLYRNGQILNSPSTIDPNGQRHLPDAWLVFPTETAANQVNALAQ